MNNVKLFIVTIIFIGLSGCISYTSKKETITPAPTSALETDEYVIASK
ncbi:hypothetical protein SAMN05216325_10863 [Nitrosomonas marina]|uniref:Lipoprotein-attachment site-containing protein n=1 Tax=Nitrosomonas marina TaxID=917 RepID=A0A1H8DZW8_9PROT|nr:hypothetical protein SAMN05216325_10863 [Nitrosomonas marina]